MDLPNDRIVGIVYNDRICDLEIPDYGKSSSGKKKRYYNPDQYRDGYG